MNILFIYGSPRRKGITSQMLDEMRKEAVAHGDRVETVRVNDLTVRPCLGCMACRKQGYCVLPDDDSVMVLKMLRDADLVVVGSPCYWGNMPGPLKTLFDRLVYGMMQETSRFPRPLMKGKRCILVSSCTTPWPFNILFHQSRGVICALREVFHYAGFRIVRTIERGSSEKHPMLTEKDLQKCHRAISRALR